MTTNDYWSKAAYEKREARTRRIIAQREAYERRQRERTPCTICGGRMSEPRNGWSTCQGGNSMLCCGMSRKES